LKDLVFDHAKINEIMSKKLVANDKTLESIHPTMGGLSSVIKNQLSFNKMLKTQLAHLAVIVPSAKTRKISGQAKPSLENVNTMTTRGDKSTRDPPYPTQAAKGKSAAILPSTLVRRPPLVRHLPDHPSKPDPPLLDHPSKPDPPLPPSSATLVPRPTPP
jgi:hypothetical protein